MDGIVHRILEIILTVEFMIGVLGNGFITVVNCVDWVKRRKISSVDQILTALALSRIGQLLFPFIYALIYALHPDVFMSIKMLKIIIVTGAMANHFSIWLAAGLSIFYFLKIANFSNSLFLYLKWRVKKVVSVTLLISLNFLILNIALMNTQLDVWIAAYKGNLSFSSNLEKFAQFSYTFSFINIIFMVIPFTLSLMTALLLIFSLWRHLKRMHHSAKGSRDASTVAHVKALQSVITFLLLYVIFFISLLVEICNPVFLDKYITVLIVWSIGVTFPSGHSFILILGNKKLKRLLFWCCGS
ncbi:taste receptor type 2 member 14-like [Urocitellus parryii]